MKYLTALLTGRFSSAVGTTREASNENLPGILYIIEVSSLAYLPL